MPQFRYLGCIIDKDGRHPDPEKIEVIRQMAAPKNVAEVRSFLGMINYYGSFVAEMRQLRALLDALLKKNVPFKWNKECGAAFNRAKEVLASDLLMTHFGPSLDIIVAADASDHGIGAVILHRMVDRTEKATWHANRSLTAAEKNASTPGHLSPAEAFLGRQLRTSLTLLKESAKEEGTRNVKIEEQFNRHHGAQQRSYHQEELVWVRDY